MIDLKTQWLKWSLSVPHSAQQLLATQFNSLKFTKLKVDRKAIQNMFQM